MFYLVSFLFIFLDNAEKCCYFNISKLQIRSSEGDGRFPARSVEMKLCTNTQEA
jgi:hypothetical protein